MTSGPGMWGQGAVRVTPARWRRHRPAVALAIAAIVVTLVVATTMRPVGLAEVLLIVLVEVILVSVLAGRTIAAGTAVVSILAVNWLLVPPYGTLQIQAQQNWVTLAVFLVLAVGASSLVEAGLAWEREAVAAATRESVVAEVLRPEAGTALESLRVLRAALQLDGAALVGAASTSELLGSGQRGSVATADLVVTVAPGYRILGWGGEILGARREYVDTLATAVARAWESEQLQAEQQRSAQLAEVDAARSALLASVGHDLRTPLAGIRVSADALAMSDADLSPADRAELLSGLRASALRLDSVIGALLDSSRIEAGVVVVAPVPTDLGEVVGRVLADFASPRVVCDQPGPVVAVVDPVLVERIVANLVANALAHTPADSPVSVSVAPDGSGAVIMVVDHGPGLGSASADVGRTRTGLGLLIVDRLARLVDARVEHRPTPGGGLTAVLHLPGPRPADGTPA